tara:strand:+ start:340 stop:570 length:231 start_codon:yes stop_codon:yes gene_type:complete
MARNPYELRMECIQIAENRLRERYLERKAKFEFLDEKGYDVDALADYPEYPTDSEIENLTDRLIKSMSGDRLSGER